MWISKKELQEIVHEAVEVATMALHEYYEKREIQRRSEDLAQQIEKTRAAAKENYDNLPHYDETESCALCGCATMIPEAQGTEEGVILMVTCNRCKVRTKRRGIKKEVATDD